MLEKVEKLSNYIIKNLLSLKEFENSEELVEVLEETLNKAKENNSENENLIKAYETALFKAKTFSLEDLKD